MEENNITIFEDGELFVKVKLDKSNETIWLAKRDIACLFDCTIDNISLHLKNIFDDNELSEEATAEYFSIVQIEGNRNVKRNIQFYNLDAIIAVGYRVNSKKATKFRQWATKIIKEYTLNGVVYNEQRLKQLERIQEIQVDMIEGVKGFDASEVLSILNLYSQGLQLLDDYDHLILLEKKNTDNKCIYVLSYEECMEVIEQSPFDGRGDLFGKERDESFKSSIHQIYQSYGGIELYPTLEDKAVNLLYFITKNHSFYDGNKRIAATIFIYFLMKNRQLIVNNRQRISNTTLATLTVLIASSKPEERENVIAFSKELIKL
ncbi:virulence protein RhuM/Fic/DOC family protein [Anaerorhabdus furcosa]|uniref:Fic/DOC family protein n=1 Tax=Anaerorhabdus furcosa TaxID=118967 RepID=A0A1T4LLQ1_9FIRM|nr:virulence protein RhuM/Fic/DOC family protein [Anaerorhabdus furcosa]SJZ55374.1 Fic/DOC family protein [Anaerorhabdus furcosa]